MDGSIVDTHQHLWDLTRFELPWLADVEALATSHLPADYLAATRGADVSKTVYMEVDVAPHLLHAEAEYVLELCGRDDNPTVGAVLSGQPGEPGFAEYVQRFAGNPLVKGFRQVLQVPETPPGTCLDAPFVAGVRLLGEHGFLFDICIRPTELADGARLAERCPDTQFVLDHCGNADPNVVTGAAAPASATGDNTYTHTADEWQRGIDLLAQRPNVVCKISGIVARVRPGWQAADLAPTIDYCLDAFGPDRVVFGGDWPVCTLGASYVDWARALRSVIAGRPAAEQERLLHGNAERLYRL
jgi:predicted TIM-barrel fold metal-dependent hydrolase